MPVRLLERENELEVLAGAVDDAAGGRGSVVLVGGEAGIGKTSLILALRERVGDRASFLTGGCEPLSVPVPLQPLRELSEAAGAGDLLALRSDDRLLLARSLMAALNECAPAVAVVEDVHWADPLTLDLLRIAARRVAETRIAFVVTYRDDEVGANPSLGLLLGDLATAPSVRRVALRPFSGEAVRRLAAPAGVDAAEVARISGGNPFLVVEAIAAGGRLPASVRDAALARAGRLGRAARAAVDAAAVIGQRVDPALLEAIVPHSADAVDEALARGVLVAEGPTLGFRHELIREAIETSVSPSRRAELHARVVAALAERPDADSARLAHHAELGGLPAEARRYAKLAATEAERVGALREARMQADRALRLGPDADPEERFDLLVLYSRAANFASTRLEDAASAADEAVALARALGDRVREGRALIVLAWALWSLDRLPEAKAAVERATALLEPEGDVTELARAHSTYVRIEASAFDPVAAIEAGPRAAELADRAHVDELRIEVAISLALARGHRGERRALDDLLRALAATRRAGLAIQTIRTFVNLVFVGVLLRDHAFVDTTTSEALRVFDECGATIPGYAIELYRARSLLDRGHWDEAHATAARTDRDWVAETATAWTVAALVPLRRGEPGGEALLERAWEELRGVPECSRHGTVRTALVEAAWLAGDRPAAIAHIEAARRSPVAMHFARSGSDLALWAARFGLELEPPPGAPEAAVLELAGDWRRAIRAWRELEAPYDAALAALPGDDRAAREAMATLQRLGATATARAFARDRAARGGRRARGPRRSTLDHPAGLTRREQEVLEHLATGATNAGIAGALHLSERTVAHHVSTILEKLGAANRTAAVGAARTRGLLPQDGQPDRAT